jgi:hypothetical protein
MGWEREEWSSGRAVGAEGWEIATCPVIWVPFVKPALMWWVKLELMAGKTEMEGGMEQIIANK